jgi:hypothetical protein
MDWLSNNWVLLALVFIVLIVLAAFGVGGRGERTDGAGSCCGGMRRDRETP